MQYTAPRPADSTLARAIPRIDPTLIEQHLSAVYGRARHSDGHLVIYSRRPFAVACFSPTRTAATAAYVCERSQICDVYHLVNLLSRSAMPDIRRRGGRGREAELQSVVALVCELDTSSVDQRQRDYPSQAVALEALRAMPLAPSIVNLSGRDNGGVHVYWLLDAPAHVVSAAERRHVKAISKAWQERLKSILVPYQMDSTFDLVRVLRIAGCINHKYENAITRPIVVEDHRYRLAEFARHVRLDKPLPTQTLEMSNVDRAVRVGRCRRYLEFVPDARSGNHGHDKTFRAACECFRFGLSLDEARGVMRWFNDRKTGDEPWREEDLEHKLRDAYQTVHQQGCLGCRLRRSGL